MDKQFAVGHAVVQETPPTPEPVIRPIGQHSSHLTNGVVPNPETPLQRDVQTAAPPVIIKHELQVRQPRAEPAIPFPESDVVELRQSITHAGTSSSRFQVLGSWLIGIATSLIVPFLAKWPPPAIDQSIWIALATGLAGTVALIAARFLKTEPLRVLDRIERRYRNSA